MYLTTVLPVLILLVVSVQGIVVKFEEAKISSASALGHNNGFSVQSGQESYFESHPKPNSYWTVASKFGILRNIVVPLSSFLVVYGWKALGVIVHVLIIVLLSIAASSTICSFTSLCNGSFLKGQGLKDQVAKLTRTYMTPENLNMVSQLVQSALEQYSAPSAWQRPGAEQPQPRVAESQTTSS